MLKVLHLIITALAVSGCASMYGTPADRALKNTKLSSYELCEKMFIATSAPTEIRGEWASELQRRSENCSQWGSILQSKKNSNQQMLTQGLRMLQGPTYRSTPTYGGIAQGTAFLKGSQSQGFNKVCIYDRLGSIYTITVGAVDICPLTQ